MQNQPLPSAPVRETDSEGRWINQEKFKCSMDAWLASMAAKPMLFIGDSRRPIAIVTAFSVRTFKSGARQMHIRAKAQRRERRPRPCITLDLEGLV